MGPHLLHFWLVRSCHRNLGEWVWMLCYHLRSKNINCFCYLKLKGEHLSFIWLIPIRTTCIFSILLSFVSCEGSHLGIEHDVRLWCEVSQEEAANWRDFQKQKQNKKTSLWQGFKGGHHIQEQLFGKKYASITSHFVLSSAGGSKEEWWWPRDCWSLSCEITPRSQGGLLSQHTLSRQLPEQLKQRHHFLKRLSSREAVTAASPSTVLAKEDKEHIFPSEISRKGLSIEM